MLTGCSQPLVSRESSRFRAAFTSRRLKRSGSKVRSGSSSSNYIFPTK